MLLCFPGINRIDEIKCLKVFEFENLIFIESVEYSAVFLNPGSGQWKRVMPQNKKV
jgi:hypothetical protein